MTTTRHHRIVRGAVIARAIVVLLAGSYVGGFLAWHWAESKMRASSDTFYAIDSRIRPLWAPLELYEESDLPLSVEFLTMDVSIQHGGQSTWFTEREVTTADNMRRSPEDPL